MSAVCSRCGSIDQVLSIEAILSTSAYSESTSRGVILNGADVTPVIRDTLYVDQNLENLQSSARRWINEPKKANSASGVSGEKFKGLIFMGLAFAFGALIPLNGGNMILLALGALGFTFFQIFSLVMFFTTEKRIARKVEAQMTPSDFAEVKARESGWHCTRCRIFFKD
jgi:hypothetical protein